MIILFLFIYLFFEYFDEKSLYFTCLKLTGHGHLKVQSFQQLFAMKYYSLSILPVPRMNVNKYFGCVFI